jgi:Flp pilus assembly protein TadD
MPAPRLRRPALLVLLLLLATQPALAAEQSLLLLYGFSSVTTAAPEPMAGIIAQLVRDELQKSGRYVVAIRTAEDPAFRSVESQQPGPDPTRLHRALRVAQSLGAQFVVQGVITAYEAPKPHSPGKVTLRITAASVAKEVTRQVFVTAEMKVPGSGATGAAKVMGPAARAAATAIVTEAIPALDRAVPEDRVQAAEQARARGQEAARSGVTGQAVDDLRRAARLTPEDAATHLALGEALVKQGMIATALIEFRQALALADEAARAAHGGAASPPAAVDVPALRLRLVRALSDRGLWDEAMAEANRGLAREPDSEALHLAVAESAIRAGDGAAALSALQRLHAARAPRDAEWNFLAAAHALAGDAPRWLDAVVRGAVAGVPDSGQYEAVIRRLDQVFRLLADEAEEAERRVLAGQLSPAAFGTASARRLAQTRVVVEYLGRLAYPEGAAAEHQVREEAWSGLVLSGEQAILFAAGGTFNDLAGARGERLRAVGRLEPARSR